MNVGELFIQLGFETSGMGNARAFQGIIDAINASAKKLENTMVLTGWDIEKALGKQAAPATKKTGDEVGKLTGKSHGLIAAWRKKTEVNQGLVSSLTKARLAYVGIAGAIVLATQKAAAYAQQLHVFSNVTGMSGQALQEWDQRAAAFGITAEETASTLRNLQKLATDVSLGQGNTKPWAFFGIDPRQDPSQILEQLATKMPKFSKAISGRMAEELGLSDKFISMIYDLQKVKADKGLLLTPKELKALEQFNIYFNQTLDSMQRQLRKFGIAMMPFAEFMVYGLSRVTKGLHTFGDIFARLNARAGDNRIFKLLAVGATILAAALFPLIFGLTGVVLVWEDLMSAMRGDESVIGFWYEQFSSLEKILTNLPILLGTVLNMLTFGKFENEIAGLAGKMSKDLGATGAHLAKREEERRAIGNWIPATSTAAIGDFEDVGVYQPSKPSPANVTQNQNVTVNVNGAQDPAKVAQEVNKTVRNAAFQMPIGEK